MIHLTDPVFAATLAPRACQSRRGLTHVEVLVMLICLCLVIVLSVPAIFHFRETQRKVACQERIQNLGLGLLTFTDENNHRFPPLVMEGTPWTVQILTHLEVPQAAQIKLTDEPMEEQPRLALPLFLCPNGQLYEPGRNCYLVNGGWGDFEVDSETEFVSESKPHSVNLDWNSDGKISEQERTWTRASGVIWRPEDVSQSWSLPELDKADGSGQTILLTETQNSNSWMSVETFDLAFVVGTDYMEPGSRLSPFAVHTESLGPYAINSSRGGRLSHCPAPSSLHADGVNVLFADGAVRTLSDKIDPVVYLKAMTPAGNRYGEFQAYDSGFEGQ